MSCIIAVGSSLDCLSLYQSERKERKSEKESKSVNEKDNPSLPLIFTKLSFQNYLSIIYSSPGIISELCTKRNKTSFFLIFIT